MCDRVRTEKSAGGAVLCCALSAAADVRFYGTYFFSISLLSLSLLPFNDRFFSFDLRLTLSARGCLQDKAEWQSPAGQHMFATR